MILTQREFDKMCYSLPEGESCSLPEGTLLVDGHDAYYDYLYRLTWVDPFLLDYSEKHAAEPLVLSMESTLRYVDWFRSGRMCPPLVAVFHEYERVYKCQNRRRLLAARAAGVSRIPVFLEVARVREVFGLTKSYPLLHSNFNQALAA